MNDWKWRSFYRTRFHCFPELVGISVDEIAFTSSFSVVTKFVKQITTFSIFRNVSTSVPSTPSLKLNYAEISLGLKFLEQWLFQGFCEYVCDLFITSAKVEFNNAFFTQITQEMKSSESSRVQSGSLEHNQIQRVESPTVREFGSSTG